MNGIEHWRRRKRYSVSEASQIIDCSVETFEAMERGDAPAGSAAVRNLEAELRAPYRQLRGELR